jgi:hypothetical protein
MIKDSLPRLHYVKWPPHCQDTVYGHFVGVRFPQPMSIPRTLYLLTTYPRLIQPCSCSLATALYIATELSFPIHVMPLTMHSCRQNVLHTKPFPQTLYSVTPPPCSSPIDGLKRIHLFIRPPKYRLTKRHSDINAIIHFLELLTCALHTGATLNRVQ